MEGDETVRKHAHQGMGRWDGPEWDSDGMTSYSTKSFHFISSHSYFSNLWHLEKQSLQSFLFFSLPRAWLNNCQWIFVPLVAKKTPSNLPFLLSLWVQEKTTEYRISESFLWIFKIHSPRILDFLIPHPHSSLIPNWNLIWHHLPGWLGCL